MNVLIQTAAAFLNEMLFCQSTVKSPSSRGSRCGAAEGVILQYNRYPPPQQTAADYADLAKMRYLNFFTQNTWQSRSNNILYLSIEKAQLIFDPLAQSVEHLTFNQGVRSSNLRWITKGSLQGLLFSLCFYCGGAVYGCNIVQIPTDYRIYLLKCVLLLW